MTAVRVLRSVAATLTGHLTTWLLLAAATGLLVPELAGRLRAATPAILAAMIAGLGVGVPPVALAAAARRPRLLALGVAAQLAVTPLAGAALWWLAGPEPIAAGLVVQAVAPSEITSPLMVRLGGGRAASALPLMVLSLLLAPLTMPLLLAAVLGAAVPVPTGDMLRSLLLTVVAPLLGGSAVAGRCRAPRLLREIGGGVSAGMVILLVLAVAGGAAAGATPPATALVLAAVGAVVLLATGLAAGWAAGRFVPGDRQALLFTTGMREFGVATAVSLGFLGPRAAVAPAVYGIVMMVAAAWLARRLGR